VSLLTTTVGVQSFSLLVLLFPDGKLPSNRWWPVVWLIIFVALAESAFWAFLAERFVGYGDISNPFHVDALDPLRDAYASYVQAPLSILAVLLPTIALVGRLWRSRGVERQQLKWVVTSGVLVALGVVLITFVLIFLGEESSRSQILLTVFFSFTTLALCGIPISMGVAILRYRLYDIDFIINRALVYGALSATVIGLYVLVVGGLGALFQARGTLAVSLVATGLVAVLFQPLRQRLQRGVNRLMYGERDDPYAVLSRLGQRLETTLAPQAALQTVVEIVSQALKLPYTEITTKRDGAFVTTARFGSPVDERVVLPLTHQGEEVGRLIVTPRSPGEEFSAQDRRLLENLSHQAAAAVHAAQLTSDLQRAREKLVNTREEERRRLRRDLHDGLGPMLGGFTLGLDASRSMLARDPKGAEALLSTLKIQTQEAVADIRRLVHDLRPPALDDLGLVPAIRQQVSKYGHLRDDLPASTEGPTHKNGLTFSVETPENLPPLPAAVEVACYRIAQEAITNVSRHAQASACRISLSVDETQRALALVVTDDGIGVPEYRSAGVGMSSMRERAEELGGTLDIEALPKRGTRVIARFWLPQKEEEQ
jgi:signal transduction histidine kinase